MRFDPRVLFGLRMLTSLVVVELCALLPTVLACTLLDIVWRRHTEPPFFWLLVAVLPMAGLLLAITRARLPSGAPRVLAAAVAAQAIAAAALFAWWPNVMWVVLAIDVLLLIALLPSAFAGRRLGLAGTATLVWVGLWFGVGILASFGEEWIVVAKAEAMAGDRPYCILTASQTDPFKHEAATTLFDLNALKMRARSTAGGSDSYRMQNHAVLNVDGHNLGHWSYMSQAFEGDTMSHPSRDTCAEKPHFARKLLLW